MGPLSGIRVVDVTMWAFGPSAAGVLSHWGADVIKIENPKSPDPNRVLGGTMEPGGASRSFKNYNRGKRAVALDLGSDAGREVLYRMIDNADVFLTSFLEPTRRKLGFDVEHIKARNQRTVYAKITGLGPLGPESGRRGYDAAVWWARGSLAQTTMDVSGAQEPTGMVGHGDTMSGMVMAGGICAALLQRSLTGVAPVVDGSLLSTAVWFNHQPIIASSPGLPSATAAPPMMGERPATSRAYKTKDERWVSFVFVNDPDDEWVDLCKHLDRTDLATDPRYATRGARAEHCADTVAVLTDYIAARTLEELKVSLGATRGVWQPVQTPAEMHFDPQVLANRYLQPVEYPTGTLNVPTPPVLFDNDAFTAKRAPDFAEHTDEVLRELGYDDAGIATLRADGVVA
ncbi:MAG: CaiB/BaiF CoA transferase family protein [Acidimicrobiia bacterium]